MYQCGFVTLLKTAHPEPRSEVFSCYCKREGFHFLSTVTNVQLILEDKDEVKIWHNMLANLDNVYQLAFYAFYSAIRRLLL